MEHKTARVPSCLSISSKQSWQSSIRVGSEGNAFSGIRILHQRRSNAHIAARPDTETAVWPFRYRAERQDRRQQKAPHPNCSATAQPGMPAMRERIQLTRRPSRSSRHLSYGQAIVCMGGSLPKGEGESALPYYADLLSCIVILPVLIEHRIGQRKTYQSCYIRCREKKNSPEIY